MRALALLLCAAGMALPVWGAAEPAGREFVQAVEFPYYLYPRQLWERELVWLRTIGIRTVAFSIPWNWHEPETGTPDFTGRTSPRRDLAGFLRLLRRVHLRAWIRPMPQVKAFAGAGWPPGGARDARAQREWLRELEQVLATQTERHGGAVAFMEGRGPNLDVPAPPLPITVVSALDPAALARSRAAIAGARGSVLWQNVEDLVYPAGWEPSAGPLFHKGAVALNGDEQPATAALRREAGLLRDWGEALPEMRPGQEVKPPTGKLPEGVVATELAGRRGAALSVLNESAEPFRGDLRAHDPATGKTLVVPGVSVPAGQVLWLPLELPLGVGSLCRECASFSGEERLVYATAELQHMEFENGILALEFAAPAAGEAVLQLARQATGPYLAAGHPAEFDWDEKTLRARLPIPAGKAPNYRVRVGLAIAPPDTSAFFVDAKRLILGQTNTISTSYSSEELAGRSRLRVPEGFTVKPVVKSPTEIDYEVSVPADAPHGSWADLAIEADGGLLGRAHLQIFRPVSVRWSEAIRLHYGDAELPVEPATATADPRAGRNFEIVIRNNSTQIQTYRIEASGAGLQFFPAKADISIGPVMERPVSLRVFGDEDHPGLRNWSLRVTGGGANIDMPMRLLLIPRGGAAAWSADLDGDGTDEWILENQKIRAVFSPRDGGRWMEFVWKDTGLNVLPETGALAGPGTAVVRPGAAALEFSGPGWKRTVRLAGESLTIEQDTPLPRETLASGKREGLSLEVRREGATRAVYTLR